jgi:hypothetical protein
LAQANEVLNSPVQASEVEVGVDPTPGVERVEVRIRRVGIGMWFAKVLGESSAPVGAFAAAATTEASGANCVAPLMIPDVWGDDTEDLGTPWQDQISQWSYGNGDTYGAFNRPGPQTGYGSDYRNAYGDYVSDYGRPITISPQSMTNQGPGAYQLWTFQGESAEITERTAECDARSVSLGGGPQYEVVTGETLPLGELSDRIADDPGTRWDAGQKQMQSSSHPDWRQSPRVLKLALYDPSLYSPGQMQAGSTVEFSNIVLFFLENVDQGAGTVTGRLLYYSAGNTDDAGAPGALVKRVRLVE